MKGKHLFQAFLFLLVVGLFFAACGSSEDPFNPYLYYTANGCPTTAPLYCPSSGKCCPSGSPYHCTSTSSCYSSAPGCSYDTCS